MLGSVEALCEAVLTGWRDRNASLRRLYWQVIFSCFCAYFAMFSCRRQFLNSAEFNLILALSVCRVE